jgi:hypothetical protein
MQRDIFVQGSSLMQDGTMTPLNDTRSLPNTPFRNTQPLHPLTNEQLQEINYEASTSTSFLGTLKSPFVGFKNTFMNKVGEGSTRAALESLPPTPTRLPGVLHDVPTLPVEARPSNEPLIALGEILTKMNQDLVLTQAALAGNEKFLL